jgi:GWxTD domain-containing protein
MVGFTLTTAASLLFALSFSTTSTLASIAPPEKPQVLTAASETLSMGQSVSQNSPPAAAPASPADQQGDPLKRPVPATKKLRKEGSAYKDWPDKEVKWIITDEERQAFKLLTNDEEREQFVESFWYRRNPAPESPENEFRDEYYRRVLYANERFSSGILGSMTDRGHIYIVYGPPDEIESHPSGGTYDFPVGQGGGSTQTFPFELWRYRYIEDVGQDIVIEFVDPCSCGDYYMTIDPNEKDALAHVPSGQERLQKFPKDSTKVLDDLDRFARLNRPPRFKDLREIISHKISYNTMPFEVLTNYVKATSNVTLVPLTLQVENQDMTYVSENGVARGAVNIYGQVTTIGGRIAQTFEDTVQLTVPQSILPHMLDKASVYGKSLPLAPGRYLLEIVVKDLNSDHVGTLRQRLEVPDFEEKLSTSSMFLADKMEPAATKDVGRGPFVIGSTFVRPRVPRPNSKTAVFKRGEKLNLWMQVYNLAVDERLGQSDVSLEFDVVQEGSNKTVLHGTQPANPARRAAGQLTFEKTFSASDLERGTYRLKVRVRDQIAKQEVEPEASFAIE